MRAAFSAVIYDNLVNDFDEKKSKLKVNYISKS